MRIATPGTAARVVVAAFGAWAVTACGGGGSALDDSKVRVIQSVPDTVTEIGPQAAQYLDTYSDCAPDLEVSSSDGSGVEQAVAAGSADIGISASNSVVAAISGGLEAKIIGSSMDGWNQALIMAPGSNAETIQDLEPPLKIGITRYASAGHYASLKLFEHLGWSDSDYEFVTVGEFSALQAGLKSEQFDGFVWGPDTAQAMEDLGDGKNIGNLAEIIGPNVQIFYFASDDAIQDHPELVKTFMSCTFKAVQRLKSDRTMASEFFETAQEKDPSVIPGLVDRDLKFVSSDGSISPEAMEGVLDAVHLTVPDNKSLTIDDLNRMYTYWGDL